MKLKEIVLGSKTNLKKLIFVFHGYGANKENLLPVGEAFSDNIECAEVHVPDGLQNCYGSCGLQWFPFSDDDESELIKDYYKIEQTLQNYIDDEIKEKGLTYKDVVLTGFSQGAMISLMLGLKLNVSAIVSFSGFLMDRNINIESKDIKILMAHGELDYVVPFSAMCDTEKLLKARGLDVQTITSERTAHGIDNRMLTGAVEFIKTLTT